MCISHRVMPTVALALVCARVLVVVQLERFKREAECARLGIPFVEEDFAANKLTESNKGFAMLQKSGTYAVLSAGRFGRAPRRHPCSPSSAVFPSQNFDKVRLQTLRVHVRAGALCAVSLQDGSLALALARLSKGDRRP